MTSVEEFPDVKYATDDGLLALGGDLSPERLLKAYSKGIFPWYNPGEPILWWTPNPRCVLFPNQFNPSRSLKKSIRKNNFTFSVDLEFEQVLDRCAEPRANRMGTWITKDMRDAYLRLHHMGHAHSVETWKRDKLVGGLYGIAMGKVFFGESMFTSVNDASKSALHYLVARLLEMEFQLIDCQITSPHLLSLGAVEIPRSEFLDRLETALLLPGQPEHWRQLHNNDLKQDRV
jgi:leucyl/phenylalanyl-tRNA--protein transferase